jgi:hypothetical protein
MELRAFRSYPHNMDVITFDAATPLKWIVLNLVRDAAAWLKRYWHPEE